MTEFTPWSGLVGGALIGLSSGLLLLLIGRIAGISGIASGLMSTNVREMGWRAAFIAGLLLAALLFPWFSGQPLPVDIQADLPTMAIGGLLVGFGTRMASGCTAGHGISGLSRLSFRSLAATATFFATAMITVFVVRAG
ncbi:YeeE/YedE family protein [Bowmanella dokdonensis]|uniref:YeeE/YedE family protein n=1 Tax=Bowmanella dokdonensis TaxID=751969 RepID=A0A939DLD0_9ALTE|nr:YeeE/YedE thiosulfate transporter family protein [Bowmanella dokdonensis]MBN7824290.1 YeeE/YedE family protein [Bowmanella dokdonensis]